MAYPQSTLEAIVESERSMFFDGEARYGRHFKHARAATMYLSLCVVTVEHDRSDTFGRLFSLMKKHHTLAFLSALRLHKVQAMLNLRQVLEAGAGAAYAIANPDVRGFADIDPFNIMDPSQKLTKKRYAWLEENYPDKSKWIADTKGQINNQSAHANIVSADATYRAGQTADVVDLPFFDAEDVYTVQADLWLISSVAITLMDLFYGVAQDVARAIGRSVLEFRPDFTSTIGGLAAESNALLDEIKESDRYRTAMRKEKQRSEAMARLGRADSMADSDNEGKTLDAVLRFIETRDHAPRENDGWSPDDPNDPDPDPLRRVDYVCTVGQTLYAFEHTRIEPFIDQIESGSTTRSSSIRSSSVSTIEKIRRSGTFMSP